MLKAELPVVTAIGQACEQNVSRDCGKKAQRIPSGMPPGNPSWQVTGPREDGAATSILRA
jgi:hypothetical protein